jgi:hypothetical protein
MSIGQKVVLSVNGYWGKGQSILCLNPSMLPILGNVGIPLCTLEYSGNGIPVAGFVCLASPNISTL